MNFIPQVGTQELSDGDLDNVSGGLAGGVGSNCTDFANSLVPVSGTVGDVVCTGEDLTGLSTGPAMDIVIPTIAGV